MKALSMKTLSFLSTCTLSCWCLLATAEDYQSNLYNQFHEGNPSLEDGTTWMSGYEQSSPNNQTSVSKFGSGQYNYENFNQENGSEANFSQYVPAANGSSNLEINRPNYDIQQGTYRASTYQNQAYSVQDGQDRHQDEARSNRSIPQNYVQNAEGNYVLAGEKSSQDHQAYVSRWDSVNEAPYHEQETSSLQPAYYGAEHYQSDYGQNTDDDRVESGPLLYGQESWEKGQCMAEMPKGEEGVDPSQEYQDPNYPGYSYRYELEYYNESKCEYEPRYCYKRHCRYVPQYYQKKCCVYVPQYYYVTRCAYVPEYYYSVKRYECPRYFSVPKCRYVKRYFKNSSCQECSYLVPDDTECVSGGW